MSDNKVRIYCDCYDETFDDDKVVRPEKYGLLKANDVCSECGKRIKFEVIKNGRT